MTLRIMLDLETMSTAANAAITQIGACASDGRAPFKVNVKLESSMAFGCKVDASTIMWWLTQSDEARASLVNGSTLSLAGALQEFTIWLTQSSTYQDACDRIERQFIGGVQCELWAFPAQFDVTILTEAYRACGMQVPWHYRGPRCLRTASALAPDVERVEPALKHNALSDALAQMLWLERIIERLSRGTPEVAA